MSAAGRANACGSSTQPLAFDGSRAPMAERIPSPTARSHREVTAPATVLVVDQSGMNRLVTRYLAHLGYTVLEAASGEGALNIVRQRRPPVDLVLSDVDMAAMDGRELARCLSAECPGPAVILMGRDSSPRIGAGLRARYQPVRVLKKPLDLDLLHELIRILLPPLPPVEEEQSAGALESGHELVPVPARRASPG
jgi:two-component system cell cycle sensor histidine kinase/response regulator CckA